jgi:mannan endo-1,4-beta-mannosidase
VRQAASEIALGTLVPFPFPSPPLPWVSVAPGVPYFQTEDGLPWHPIGQNDAISWSELNPLFRRRDPAAVEDYLSWLAAHGVTCMRLMLEYAQVRHRYFETAPGKWSPNLVRFWDDLFALSAQHNIRILLTPFDTFWMWLKFHHHPYSLRRGGPLDHPRRMLLSRETRDAIKARLTFAAERWGGSGALFAWDLWNEIHPAQAEDTAEPFLEFIQELSDHVRQVELRAFGRAHPQTVSLFGPELHLKPHLQMEHAIFRHPSLDFATIHIYEHGTIDDPRNTVDAAIAMGRIVQQSLTEIHDTRPFLDTEHGPIHSFKDRRETLPEHFDDEYFRHMQWAHLASGGAGGGMRWPNRHPHTLTAGMRREQRSLARFLPHIDWLRFNRRNITDPLRILEKTGPATRKPISSKRLARFACATQDQALVYLLRRDTLQPGGRLNPRATPLDLTVEIPTLTPGPYRICIWNTATGEPVSSNVQSLPPNSPVRLPHLVTDIALAIQAAR